MRRRHLNSSVMSWLRCFEAAARALSFTRAAAELCLTQGAVSQQVRELEDRLGVALFRRLPRQLVLTNEGEQLRTAVTSAFDDLEVVLARLQDRGADGPLALNCYSSFALLWLMPRIGSFYREYPDIDLRVSAEHHRLERATILSEGIDAAVRYDLGDYHDLESGLLLDEYLTPVASPRFVEAHPQVLEPGQFDHAMLLHDAIAWEGATPDAEWQHWLRATGLQIPPPSQGKRFNMAQLAIDAALDGQGVAMGRAALVLDHLLNGRLVPLFGHAVRSPAAYRLVHVAQPLSRVEALSQWLRDECEKFRLVRDKHLPALVDIVL